MVNGFLSFAKNIGKNISNMYNQKPADSAIKSVATKVATDAIKTASKRAIQKTAETAGDLIGNKFADKITSKSKKSKELHLKGLSSTGLHSNKANNEIPKERYISPKERQQIIDIIDELRLI